MRSSNGLGDLGETQHGSSGASMRGSLSSIPAAIDLRGMSGLHSRPKGHHQTGGSLQSFAKAKPHAGGLLDACSGRSCWQLNHCKTLTILHTNAELLSKKAEKAGAEASEEAKGVRARNCQDSLHLHLCINAVRPD